MEKFMLIMKWNKICSVDHLSLNRSAHNVQTHIWQKMIDRIINILDTLSTSYTQESHTYWTNILQNVFNKSE